MTQKIKQFGTAPVFFTAISTILGAILFLRFGFAVGTLGFWGVILIILLGHLVTIPTALAISEIATNKRVEGGGEYFIISRSFGLNIGATIGMALFFSQAISVAFYVIAFTEAFEYFFNFIFENYGFVLPRQIISLPVMLGLAILIIKKGANVGVKALYFVIGILFISLAMFFLGDTAHAANTSYSLADSKLRNPQSFFVVFAIIFPAFTGITAGVGLSGDLKNPSKSIPRGTILATIAGMIIYFFVVYKLASSASVEDLLNKQLIMGQIAIAGVIVIPLGLAASTFSSALGSFMVAPRTLQALALDRALPSKKINRWLAAVNPEDNEPTNASKVTAIIAFVFVAMGSVDAVASVISMFFMMTYGSLCLISFLNHFGSSPSYRPTFRSRWYISLVGFLVSIWVMFKINTLYAFIAISVMTLVYLYINHYHKNRRGFASIFVNALFQLNRDLQVMLQKRRDKVTQQEWRPSAICISNKPIHTNKAFELLNWISYKYGFGTYLHFIEDYYSKSTVAEADKKLHEIIETISNIDNFVFIDTIISPSYTSAISQSVQIPGVAGMENNMVIFEYDKENPENLKRVTENFALVNSGQFDICILACSEKPMNMHNDMSTEENIPSIKKELRELVLVGRLPINEKNVKVIIQPEGISPKTIIAEKSSKAGLTLIGLREEMIKHEKEELFDGYDDLGTILFVHSKNQKSIK